MKLNKWAVLAALICAQFPVFAADEGREFSYLVLDKEICRYEYDDERGLLGSSERCFERMTAPDTLDITEMANRAIAHGRENVMSVDQIFDFGAALFVSDEVLTRVIKSYKQLTVDNIAFGLSHTSKDELMNTVIPFFARVVWQSNPRVDGRILSGMMEIEGNLILPKDGDVTRRTATTAIHNDSGEAVMANGELLRTVINPILAAQIGTVPFIATFKAIFNQTVESSKKQ